MQEKRFVDLSDILALRFERTECHGTVSFPLDKAQNVRSLHACPACAPPLPNKNDSWMAEVVMLGNMIEQVRTAQAVDPQYTKFKLSFEIVASDEE